MRDVTGLLAAVSLLLVAGRGEVATGREQCSPESCLVGTLEPRDFHSAQQQCAEEHHGHLVTVRSIEVHDFLTSLLEADPSGRFWIGLQRESGCPDPAEELRGFQWVSGETRSDFSNWAPGLDDSCSTPRCVSVSGRDGFKWTQQPCDEQADGFVCEEGISGSCAAMLARSVENYKYLTPEGIQIENRLWLPVGTLATRLSTEEKLLCVNQQWLQAPWTCEILEGGCEYKCATDPNKEPTCYCPPGQTVHPGNKVTCEVGLDDPCLALRCAHACYDMGGSPACTCEHGFKLAADGRSCVDFNDCKDERQCPEENTVCVNTEGGFECPCKPGFKTVGERCVDVDECVSAPCEHGCSNTPGSYVCTCFPGYILDPREPHKCKQHCGEMECVAVCDPNNALQCTCPEGYIAEPRDTITYCLDIDECDMYFCDQHCTNSYGGYECSCQKGYDLVDGYACVINEHYAESTTSGTSPAPLPRPEPTRRPSGVSVGAFVGIILCTTFFIVLLVFLAHHALSRRGKIDSAGAPADEAHGLRQVAREP